MNREMHEIFVAAIVGTMRVQDGVPSDCEDLSRLGVFDKSITSQPELSMEQRD